MSDAFKKPESFKSNESLHHVDEKIQAVLASKKLMVASAAQHHAAFWSEQ
jgi:hypothetical protein